MALRKKAMDKNPDEFHFKMIHNQLKVCHLLVLLLYSTNINCIESTPTVFFYEVVTSAHSATVQDGVHVLKPKEETMTEEQKKVMRTQDIRYVEMKRVSEMKVGLVLPIYLCICGFIFLKMRIMA